MGLDHSMKEIAMEDSPKEYYIDAALIATEGIKSNFKVNNILLKRCVSKGDYQQTKGIRSQMKIPTGNLFGFRKFDIVKYLGKLHTIKGRMNSGYCILMNEFGEKVDLKPILKFEKMKRVSVRKSWVVMSVPLN